MSDKMAEELVEYIRDDFYLHSQCVAAVTAAFAQVRAEALDECYNQVANADGYIDALNTLGKMGDPDYVDLEQPKLEDFTRDFIASQKDVDPELMKIFHDNIWSLYTRLDENGNPIVQNTEDRHDTV